MIHFFLYEVEIFVLLFNKDVWNFFLEESDKNAYLERESRMCITLRF